MKFSKLILLFLICTVFPALVSCKKAPPAASEYAVVVSADASDTDVYAAQMLSEYLSALDENEYPVISDLRHPGNSIWCHQVP